MDWLHADYDFAGVIAHQAGLLSISLKAMLFKLADTKLSSF